MGILNNIFRKSRETKHAEQFAANAAIFIQNKKNVLIGKSVFLDKVIQKPEFDTYTLLFAHSVTVYSACIFLNFKNPRLKNLLQTLVKSTNTKINNAKELLVDLNKFLEQMQEDGYFDKCEITMKEAGAYWVLFKLVNNNNLDYPEIKRASIILSEWIYKEFTVYWEPEYFLSMNTLDKYVQNK